MNRINSKDITIPAIIGLIVNLVSGYLFTIQKINITMLAFIIIGSLLVILIISIQIKTNDLIDKISSLESGQQKLKEKLKIHEQLIDMKAEIKELQKEVFKR